MWLIATIEDNILVADINRDIAHQDFQKLYRSETQAGYAVFLFLQEFTKFYGLDIPTVFYYCDKKGLVTKIKQQLKDFSKFTERNLLHLISTILPS